MNTHMKRVIERQEHCSMRQTRNPLCTAHKIDVVVYTCADIQMTIRSFSINAKTSIAIVVVSPHLKIE